MRQVADLVRAAGGDELFTSHVVGVEGAPGRFYEQLGFVPTGDVDPHGEVIIRLRL